MVGSAYPSCLEMALILLTETVAIHVQVLIIEVGKPSFKGLFLRIRPMIMFQELDSGYISFQELLIQLFGKTWG